MPGLGGDGEWRRAGPSQAAVRAMRVKIGSRSSDGQRVIIEENLARRFPSALKTSCGVASARAKSLSGVSSSRSTTGWPVPVEPDHRGLIRLDIDRSSRAGHGPRDEDRRGGDLERRWPARRSVGRTLIDRVHRDRGPGQPPGAIPKTRERQNDPSPTPNADRRTSVVDRRSEAEETSATWAASIADRGPRPRASPGTRAEVGGLETGRGPETIELSRPDPPAPEQAGQTARWA